MDVRELMNRLTPEEQDGIYRAVWKEHVAEDVLARIHDAYSDKLLPQDGQEPILDEELDSLCGWCAGLYVYEGQYDCTLSYWDNIDALIDNAIDDHIENVLKEREAREDHFMIHSYGYDAPEDVTDIRSMKDAQEKLSEMADKWCENHSVNIEEFDYDQENDDEFSGYKDSKGAVRMIIYKIPFFENEAQKVLFDAQIAMNDAESAAFDYKFSLVDDSVGECVGSAIELMYKAFAA